MIDAFDDAYLFIDNFFLIGIHSFESHHFNGVSLITSLFFSLIDFRCSSFADFADEPVLPYFFE